MTADEKPVKQPQVSLISQDLSSLNNSDGKIVKSQSIDLHDEWAANREFYKIRYLSDGLEVVGFIVKPANESSKYPVIVFNRGGNREYGKITSKSFQYLSYLSSFNFVCKLLLCFMPVYERILTTF